MDRGLMYGDGLFETIAVRQGQPRFLDLHLARLAEGCRRLVIPPPNTAGLETQLRAICTGLPRGTLKVVLSRGPGGRGYRPPAVPQPTLAWGVAQAESNDRGPVRLRWCHTRVGRQPATAGLKTLNCIPQVLARAEWQDDDVVEGLMLDDAGAVVGGTMSNVFIVRDGRLRTPVLAAAGVRGIMRRVVMEQAKQLGVPVEEALLLPGDIEAAAEVFLTNALMGIQPVGALGPRRWSPGPVTARLCRSLAAIGVGECAAHS